MAGLPLSRSALDRLGERLVAQGYVAPEDEAIFAEVVDAYQQILDQVEQQLANLGLQAGTRVKTTGVLIDKLQRERTCRLSQVQDLAGARIVVKDRTEQDKVVELLVQHFDECCPKKCKIMDRREVPSHGYRAVHVIVFPEGVPVEIQVRTELQDVWAQIFESIADRWGRGIRYGEPPDDLPLLLQGQTVSRRMAHQVLLNLSNEIAGLEVRRKEILEAEEILASLKLGTAELQSAQKDDSPDRPLVEALPPRGIESLQNITQSLISVGAVPAEEAKDPASASIHDVVRMMDAGRNWYRGVLAAQRQDHDGREQAIRGTLQVIARAAAEVEAQS